MEQPFEGQVLIQIRPMHTERGNLDMIQLLGRANCQTRILRRRETNLCAALHAEDDSPSNVSGGAGSVS